MLKHVYPTEPNSFREDNEPFRPEFTSPEFETLELDSDAQAALASSPVVDLRELRVVREGKRLLISGRVNCFYHKQLAQETVRPHAADLLLDNQVAVIKPR